MKMPWIEVHVPIDQLGQVHGHGQLVLGRSQFFLCRRHLGIGCFELLALQVSPSRPVLRSVMS